MSLIEGIGDEVTVLAACLLVLAVVIIAWTSTHVDVRMHTAVVIIDRERFGELLRRVRSIAVRGHFSGDADAADLVSQSSANASEAHTVTDSLLVSDASTSAQVTDVKPCSSNGDDRSADSENECLCKTETDSLSDVAGESLQCQSTSVGLGKDCTESAAPLPDTVAVTAAGDNQHLSQCSSTINSNLPPGSIEVRLQFVDGRQRTVVANPDDTIGHFKRRHFASELARNLVVRFIAGGQELKDEASTLRSHRISVSGAVLHCLVTPARAASPPADEQQNAGYQFDIGILMFPLFGTLLIALWYARVVYRGYFNGTSTFSLLAISFLYIIALLASLRGSGQTEQHPHIE